MNFLADENIETATIQWLRAAGHDVLWAVETLSSEPDTVVLMQANASSRILLTRDPDFGQLVFERGLASKGVILLRLRARNQWERLSLLQLWWREIEAQAPGHFLVVANRGIRRRRLSERPSG